MKLLILGNHTCGNRGDSAILRGLLDAINILNPQAEVDVMSRYPVSSSWLLNRPVMGDPLFLQMKQHNSAAGWCLRTMLAHWRNVWRHLANWTLTNWLRLSNVRAKKSNTILTSR